MAGTENVKIYSQGVEMKPSYNLIYIDIIEEVNKIPIAEITITDASSSKQKFAMSDDDFFKPGREITIALGQDNVETVFVGFIFRHSIQVDEDHSWLIISLKDPVIKLTTQRKSAVFREMTDSEVIEKIIDKNQIEFSSNTQTKVKHQEMVQFSCTDWDFILSRADANGCWILANDGKISLIKPEFNLDPKHTFEYGKNEIYEMNMEADIRQQYASVESRSWDLKNQELLPPQKAQEFSLTQGNFKGNELAKNIGLDNYQLISLGQLNEGEMQAWADAKLVKSRISMLQGRLKMLGISNIKPGDIIEIAGVGERFNGKTLVTGTRHQISEQGWKIDVQFGLSANWFAQQNNDIIEPPAAGLIPAIHGLQVGIIDKYEDDPDKQFRVKVRIPSIEKDGIVWARLATVDAGKERGVFFRPEVGDEVILGFINDDPRQAIILGAMHSEKNTLPPDLKVTKENNKKGIVTKESLKILFDDEKKSIEISTSNGNIIRLSDEDKGIYLEDENGNTMTINDEEFNFKSNKDIIIEGKNIKIKGSKVDIN